MQVRYWVAQIRILLVYVRANYSPYLPEGLLQLASILEKENHIVKVIDPLFEKWTSDFLKEFNPDIVGLSYLTFDNKDLKKIVSDIRKFNKTIKILGGGHHLTFKPEESINQNGIDIGVIGEADIVLPSLIKELEKDKDCDLKKVRGIIFKDKTGRLIRTLSAPTEKDLDSLPFPAFHLINMEKYLIPPGYIRSVFLNRVLTIYTSRGCAYSCTYCGVPPMFKKMRFRSVKKFIKQLKVLIEKYQLDGLYFSDEVFTINKKRTYELCKELIKLKLPWATQTRVDLVDEKLLKTMAKSGCKQLDYGVESGSDRILKLINKRITREQIIKTFNMTKKAKIRAFATIMVGHPTETKEDLEATIDLLNKIKPNFTLTQFLTPTPGTHLYDWAVKNKKIDKDIYGEKNYHFYMDTMPLVNLSAVSDKVLKEYKKKIELVTFKWNYLNLITPHNMIYLVQMLYYNVIGLKEFQKILKQFYKERSVSKLIINMLYNYQKRIILDKTQKRV